MRCYWISRGPEGGSGKTRGFVAHSLLQLGRMGGLRVQAAQSRAHSRWPRKKTMRPGRIVWSATYWRLSLDKPIIRAGHQLVVGWCLLEERKDQIQSWLIECGWTKALGSPHLLGMHKSRSRLMDSNLRYTKEKCRWVELDPYMQMPRECEGIHFRRKRHDLLVWPRGKREAKKHQGSPIGRWGAQKMIIRWRTWEGGMPSNYGLEVDFAER
jgi:hypothetical protein